MIEADRLIAATGPRDREEVQDRAIRPLSLAEYIGLNNAETVSQRVGQHAGASGGTHQGERWQVELDRARRRAFANHDVELKVFHRRVQHFLDDRRQPVNLVDKQHVMRFKVGQ